MSVSAAVCPHAVLPQAPPALARYVAVQAQSGLPALAAELDALAVQRDVLAQAQAVQQEQDEPGQPGALVVERAGLPEPDALVVAQGGPPAAWAALWFRVGELYAWAVAVPPVLAAAWAGQWFRVWVLCVWAVAVSPVRLDALAVQVAYGLAALAAHGLAARLGVQAHWALQQVHWVARVSRPVWWPAGWDGPAHWALRLVWGAALRVRLAA